MTPTLLALATFSSAQAAIPSYARDWSIVLSHPALVACPIDFDELLAAHTKSGMAGSDPAQSEYGIGWVYPAANPQVSLTLYDAATDGWLGYATADDLNNENVYGDITDIQAILLTDNCSNPGWYKRYFVEVTTVNNPGGFLNYVW